MNYAPHIGKDGRILGYVHAVVDVVLRDFVREGEVGHRVPPKAFEHDAVDVGHVFAVAQRGEAPRADDAVEFLPRGFLHVRVERHREEE